MAALRAATSKLFAASQGKSPILTHVKYVERFLDGFEYDTFDASLPGGSPLGRFTRIQVHPDAASQIDFIIALEKDHIVGFQPVRPIVLGGQPFKELEDYFNRMRELPIQAYAHPLEKLFAGLRLAGPAAAGPLPPLQPRPGATPIIQIETRKLKPGQPMPAFSVTDLWGRSITNAALTTRPCVVALGTIREEASRVMLKTAERFVAGVPEAAILTVLADSPGDKETYLGLEKEPSVLLAHAALDPDKKLMNAFQAPHTPYLYVFDAAGKVAFSTIWRGADALASDLRDVFSKILGRSPGGQPKGGNGK